MNTHPITRQNGGRAKVLPIFFQNRTGGKIPANLEGLQRSADDR